MEHLSTTEIKRLAWLVGSTLGTIVLAVGINIGYAIR